VSDKLSSKEIRNNDDLSLFLSDQYSKAVVGKAQSPFGNTHQAGNKQIIAIAMKRAFDELEITPSPTFAERESDPLFSQLDEKLPTPESAILQDENSYLKWAEANPQKSPDFVFFQFVENGQKLPTELKDSAKIVARRILFQDDGSQNFQKWVSLLNFGYLGDFGKVVQDEYKKLITGFTPSQIIFAKSRIDLSRKIFQPSYSGQLSNLPNYLTPEFVAKFTFTGNLDLPLDYLQRIGDKAGISSIVNSKDPLLKFGANFVAKIRQYGNPIEGEYKKYYDSLQTWISSLAEASENEEKERDPNDPY